MPDYLALPIRARSSIVPQLDASFAARPWGSYPFLKRDGGMDGEGAN